MEKYKHVPEDFENDLILIKKFTEQFLAKFEGVINLRVYKNCAFQDCLGYGAESIFITDHNSMIWISTGINPNGISKQIGIGRDYTIQCKRYKPKSNFYSYSLEIENVLEEFKNFILPDSLKENNLSSFKFILS